MVRHVVYTVCVFSIEMIQMHGIRDWYTKTGLASTLLQLCLQYKGLFLIFEALLAATCSIVHGRRVSVKKQKLRPADKIWSWKIISYEAFHWNWLSHNRWFGIRCERSASPFFLESNAFWKSCRCENKSRQVYHACSRRIESLIQLSFDSSTFLATGRLFGALPAFKWNFCPENWLIRKSGEARRTWKSGWKGTK
jgi:hypothetical protein